MKKLLSVGSILALMFTLANCVQGQTAQKKTESSEEAVDSAASEYTKLLADEDDLSGEELAAIEDMTDEEKRQYADERFVEKFEELSDEEKRVVLKKISEIMKQLKNLSESERQARLRELRPPLPSREVLEEVAATVPKP